MELNLKVCIRYENQVCSLVILAVLLSITAVTVRRHSGLQPLIP